MPIRHLFALAFLTSLSLPCAPALAGDDSGGDPAGDLYNYREIVPGLVASAQPTPKGVKELYSKGVRVIINLRDPEAPGAIAERAEAERLHMEYFTYHMSNAQTPKTKTVAEILDLIHSKLKDWKSAGGEGSEYVEVHCQWGAERTNIITGLYAVLYAGKSAQGVYEEMEDQGFNHEAKPEIEPLNIYYWDAAKRGKLPPQ